MLQLGLGIFIIALVLIVPLSIFTAAILGLHEYTTLNFTLSIITTLIITSIITLAHVLNDPDSVHTDPSAYPRLNSYAAVVLQLWFGYSLPFILYSAILWLTYTFLNYNTIDTLLISLGTASLITIIYVGMDPHPGP